MTKDELCSIEGYTRFELMEKYNISLMRISKFGNEKKWSACSAVMEFDYGYDDGYWAEGNTAFEALINCINKIDNNYIYIEGL